LEITQRVFNKFDANGSGEIDIRELGLLVKALGLNMQQYELNTAMIDLDKDKNGAISFEEFWDWFQTAAVIKNTSGGLQKGLLKLKQGMQSQVDGARKEIRSRQAADAEVGNITRPQTAASSRSSTKMGSWVTRSLDSPAPTPELMQRMRPMTAMERGREVGRTTYSGSETRKLYSSSGWRSMSRSDYRPPTAKIQPPRLNLPKRVLNRPMSAQPHIRTPGAPQHPKGCTSGFKL